MEQSPTRYEPCSGFLATHFSKRCHGFLNHVTSCIILQLSYVSVWAYEGDRYARWGDYKVSVSVSVSSPLPFSSLFFSFLTSYKSLIVIKERYE